MTQSPFPAAESRGRTSHQTEVRQPGPLPPPTPVEKTDGGAARMCLGETQGPHEANVRCKAHMFCDELAATPKAPLKYIPRMNRLPHTVRHLRAIVAAFVPTQTVVHLACLNLRREDGDRREKGDGVARLLLVHQDLSQSSQLAAILRSQHHELRMATTGAEGISMSLSEQPELIMLDLDLPDCSSLAILRMFKSMGPQPVIVCGSDRHVIGGLARGADGYLRRPFSAELAAAHIQSLLSQRACTEQITELTVGDLHIDLRSHCATLGGRRLHLRPKEFRLLFYLARNAGRVVSKQELIIQVWGNSLDSTAKTIDVHLSWLRRRLGESAARPCYLYSVRGVGVKFCAPSTQTR